MFKYLMDFSTSFTQQDIRHDTKKHARKCPDHRTIYLITTQFFFKIIYGIINDKFDEDVSEPQFGFRNGVGATEALIFNATLSIS